MIPIQPVAQISAGRRLRALARLAAALCCSLALSALAAPALPTSDDVVVETLPTLPAWRSEERALKRRLAQHPRDPETAAGLARHYLAQARSRGDARYAGLAIGALSAWRTPARDPLEIVVLQATLAQHVHDFEAAEDLLRVAVRRAPGDAQAWLTLATVRRVRGDLQGSDLACRGVSRAGQPLYGAACSAENLALRGQTAAATNQLAQLLAEPAAAPLRPWLLTTLAVTHELAGRIDDADASYRAALVLGADDYTRLAHADLLLRQRNARAVQALLDAAPRSDAVLLRQALAARASGSATAGPLTAELDARLRAASARSADGTGHLRERARFALELADDARTALSLARRNLALQREPEDWLLFAQAAAAAGDRAALTEVKQRMSAMGVRDARVDTLD